MHSDLLLDNKKSSSNTDPDLNENSGESTDGAKKIKHGSANLRIPIQPPFIFPVNLETPMKGSHSFLKYYINHAPSAHDLH